MSPSKIHLVESTPLPYLLSIPSERTASPELWPVLFFLHGYGEGPPLPIRKALRRHGPLNPGAAPKARSEFIVVAPQLPERGDFWHRYAGAVEEIARGVQARRRGDPRRTYLTGFSYGGNGVFDLALEQPGLWAALWAVDPTRVPPEDPDRPVWLSSGEVSRHRQSAFFGRLKLKPFEEGELGDRVYVDEGQDHVGTATLAYRDERIYRWLLSKRH